MAHTLITFDLYSVGQMIDGPQNGTAPGPWDIQASPPSLFQDYNQSFEVPHTASVKVSLNLGFSSDQWTFSPTI